MQIALVGYGKMGKEVENQIKESGRHEVVSVSFEKPGDVLDKAGIKKADVVIDFTVSDAVINTIGEVSAMGKNIVIGTTGWYDKINEAKQIVKKSNTGLIYGSNFSVGANIYFKIVAEAAKLFSKFGGYDVYGFEVHHSGKKDSPSGTALKIGKAILNNFPSKKSIQTEKVDRQIKEDELHFASVRGGRNPGYHEVVFDSSADSVTLSHQAHGRAGFAKGAILAAEFIKDKKGFYSFDEVFK